MSKPEIREHYYTKSVDEWTLDEHTFNNFITASSRIDEVRMNYYNGKLSMHDLKGLGWVFDWLGGIVRDVADKLDD